MTADVIGGVARIPHDAIEDFIRRAEAHLESRARKGDDFLTIGLLDDAVVNLRQVMAEYALVAVELAALRASFGKGT